MEKELERQEKEIIKLKYDNEFMSKDIQRYEKE